MIRHTLKISQHLLQDFQSVPEHFGTLCINGLKAVNKTKLLAKKNSFTDVWQGPKYTSAEITDVLETFSLMPLNPNDSFVTHLGSFDKITHVLLWTTKPIKNVCYLFLLGMICKKKIETAHWFLLEILPIISHDF